jgi:hypothetical protein
MPASSRVLFLLSFFELRMDLSIRAAFAAYKSELTRRETSSNVSFIYVAFLPDSDL